MEVSSQDSKTFDVAAEKNLIELISLILQMCTSNLGGTSSTSELIVMDYLLKCNARDKEVCISSASQELQLPKATVSRIFTELRSKGITVEIADTEDRRRHVIKISDEHFPVLQGSLQMIMDWCQVPENTLISPSAVGA
jgi:DNA-binding MarR family transcriptional regulator